MIFRSAKAEFCESLLQPGELASARFFVGSCARKKETAQERLSGSS